MGGRDKLLEHVDGGPQLRRLTLAAAALGNKVYIALPSADHPRLSCIDDLDITVLVVPGADEGMGATMREAVAQLPPCTHFMIVLGDLVEIGTQEMRTVLAAIKQHPDALILRGTTATGKTGHPIVFHASLRDRFATLSGDTGAQDLTRSFAAQTVFVPLSDNAARCDLDTPEEWANWRAKTGR